MVIARDTRRRENYDGSDWPGECNVGLLPVLECDSNSRVVQEVLFCNHKIKPVVDGK